MLEVNASLIRFWEKEFPSIQPKKNKKGNRLFTPKEIANIEHIYILVKENGYTLEGAKKALKSKKGAVATVETESDQGQMLSRLQDIKKTLLSWKN